MATYNGLGFDGTNKLPIIPTSSDLINVPGLSIASVDVTATAAELNILDGVTATAVEINLLDGVTATTAELNILDGVTSTAAELNILDGVTATTAELNILDGVTSTAAELNILDGVTASTAELNILDGVTATAAELNYLDVTAIGTAEASKAVVLDANKDISGLRNVSIDGDLTVNGTTTTINSTTVTIDDPIFTLGGDQAPASDDNKDRGIEFRWHNGSAAKVGFFGMDDTDNRFKFIPDATNTSEVFSGDIGDFQARRAYLNAGGLYLNNVSVSATAAELNLLDGVTATTAELNILDGVTSTAAELNILDGVTATTAELNILDGVTSTAAELNILDGVTASTAELNILDGVTSTAAEINLLDGVTATTAELNYLDGASANLATFALPASTTISSFGASLVDDANASAARTTLGLGTIATQAANSVNIDGGAIDGTIIGGGTAAAGTFTDIVGTSLDLNGDLDMSGAARDIVVAGSQAAALEIKEGSDAYITIDSSNTKVIIGQNLDVADGFNIVHGQGTMVMSSLTVAGSSAVSAYQALYVNTSGQLAPADANAAGLAYYVVGFAMEDGPAGGAAVKQVASLIGQATPMKFDSAPSSSDAGKPVYLHTTAGQVSLTAPSSAGEKIFRVGFLLDGSGEVASGSGAYSVLFQPQFIAIA